MGRKVKKRDLGHTNQINLNNSLSSQIIFNMSHLTFRRAGDSKSHNRITRVHSVVEIETHDTLNLKHVRTFQLFFEKMNQL